MPVLEEFHVFIYGLLFDYRFMCYIFPSFLSQMFSSFILTHVIIEGLEYCTVHFF